MTNPWDALTARLKPAGPPPEALTITALMVDLGLKRTAADRSAEALVKEGLLAKGRFIKDGRWQTFYWPAGKGVKSGKNKRV